MEYFIRNKILILLVSVCSLLFVSCESNVEEKVQGVDIKEGAIIQNDSGEFSNFNLLDGSYSKVESDKVVGIYNSRNESYISTKDKEYFYYNNGVENKINGVSIDSTNLKMSRDGSYISYFTKEDGMFELKLRSLKDDCEVEFNSNVYISSTYMDWIDDENIVYYGINDEKVNGIFIYNLKNKEENLFYKLDNGIIQYLKSIDTGLICIQETVDNGRILRLIDRNGEMVQILSKDVMKIKDILSIGDKYYFLGKINGGIESIYKIENNKLKRVVFDFPAHIDLDKGLSKDEDGNLLFIGGSDKNSSFEEIYKINAKGTISKIKDSAREYSFVNYQ
ncbi:MAG: hypothetical protein E7213_02580 [Clostridium sp.]|nr:hypothetical protein [Clostridium sp.]